MLYEKNMMYINNRCFRHFS